MSEKDVHRLLKTDAWIGVDMETFKANLLEQLQVAHNRNEIA
jgi:hypothetical protein